MSAYRLAFKNAALKFLESTIPEKLRAQVKKKAEKLKEDPFPPGHKKLSGTTPGADNIYRVRSGDYRILYVVIASDRKLLIIDIDHRKDVYRKAAVR